jgi:hypothetical protein
LDRCLEWGGRYAWSVKAVGSESGWSELLLFQVASPEIAQPRWLDGSREAPTEGDRGEEIGAVGGDVAPPTASSPPAAAATEDAQPSTVAPASDLLVVGGVPVTLESYDHSMVFNKGAGGLPQVTTTSFAELGSVSIELADRCTSPLFVTRWNLLAMANAVAFSLEAGNAARGDLAVSVDDATGANIGNSDIQSFSVNGLGEDLSLTGASMFTMLEDVSAGTREIYLLARRENLSSASIGFNSFRLGVLALGFDCELIFPP